MYYCLSLDVAKGKSMACMTSRDGEILLKPKEYRHRESELEQLYRLAESIGDDYTVFMEATGIYHLQPERFFRKKGKEVIVANALLISMGKSTLRKTKTDKTDSEMLGLAYFNGNYSISRQTVSLQAQSRLVESISEQRQRCKVSLKMKGQICYPALEETFRGQRLYGPAILQFTARFPHPDLVRKSKIEKIEQALNCGIRKGCGKHVYTAQKIIKTAEIDLFPGVDMTSEECHAFSHYAKELIRLNEEAERETVRLTELAEGIFPYEVRKTFEGIGDLIAAYLTAELGDITRFEDEKKLIAFCGLDPTIIQSGKSINYHGPISKRGDAHARMHLYQAIMMIMRNDGLTKNESDITSYYKKKRSEGKHHYAAVIACTTKLLRKMFYRCRDMKSSS